jgi:N-formylglutamate deformylase
MYMGLVGADVQETEGLGRLVVVHIPHASLVIPPDIRETFVVLGRELEQEQLRMTDRYTDELYRGLAAPDATICFPVSRLVVDPERFLDDEGEPMAAKGMGATYMRTSDGLALRDAISGPERQQLLSRFYEPHHRNLTRAVHSALAARGKCLIVDGHSFPSGPLPCDLDQTPQRPDICIGSDSRHTPQWLAREAVDVFTRRGLRVEVNRPFSGAMVPAQCYGTDMRVHGVMIEINRRLYMDEATGAKLRGFDDFRALVHKALRDLITAYVSHRD